MTYFNTTNLRGQQLAAYNIQAQKQDDMVVEFFRRNPHAIVTTEDLWIALPALARGPITSTRRAFSNLLNRGLIEKTDAQVTGLWGKPIHLWRSKGNQFPLL